MSEQSSAAGAAGAPLSGLGGMLSRVEFIEVSASLDEVACAFRGFPEMVREWSNASGSFEFRIESDDKLVGKIHVHIEEIISGPYSTAIDVFESTWSENPGKVKFIFYLISRRTRWEVASRFDGNDHPLAFRPLQE
ncbi:hypothetical protein [Nocardiopsis algeriensis]|uniref:Uncharacterized protein n=1 Tax=Nocardiopsis algeriensis TaxID=1478215 RepID=A0A841IL55_9ACTN|nr:hypothetical protein [Nocardiopsis algeriensis]MBB6119519.1 hypothetical protein [Nocardiopsis algeriensis]